VTVSALLSEDFDAILDVAVVDESYDFGGRCGDYDFYFSDPFREANVLWTEGVYSVCDCPESDNAAVVLFFGREPVGFYLDLMIWIDEAHRGRGLSSRMIAAFADCNGPGAFERGRDIAWPGMGFSPAGYHAHLAARRIALETENSVDPPVPGS
jgi:GNAT superfamily N-acetyltransferase